MSNEAIALVSLAVANLGALVGFFLKLNNSLIILETKVEMMLNHQSEKNEQFKNDINGLGQMFRTKIHQEIKGENNL